MGRVPCRDGILMDPSNIVVIFYLPPPSTAKKLRTTLGHTGYYRKFIRGYAKLTTPMEKLLKKDVKFQWSEQCQESLDFLKNKMVTTPISVFPRWKKEIHVHVDASFVALGFVLAHTRKVSIYHPTTFSCRKLSMTKNNYTMKKIGLVMVYALQKF